MMGAMLLIAALYQHLTFCILYASLAQASDAIDLPSLYGQLSAALQTHGYMMAGALVTGAVVALAKQGWLSNRIALLMPARYLPYVAVLLGVLGTASAEIVAGKPWGQALFDGVAAGMGAVFGHQAIVESARNGKEIVPAAPWVPRTRTKTDPDIVPPHDTQV